MKRYYIKERSNPRLSTYFSPMGQLTKKEADKHEHPLYGDNVMIPYNTIEEYNKAIEKLEELGYRVI